MVSHCVLMMLKQRRRLHPPSVQSSCQAASTIVVTIDNVRYASAIRQAARALCAWTLSVRRCLPPHLQLIASSVCRHRSVPANSCIVSLSPRTSAISDDASIIGRSSVPKERSTMLDFVGSTCRGRLLGTATDGRGQPYGARRRAADPRAINSHRVGSDIARVHHARSGARRTNRRATTPPGSHHRRRNRPATAPTEQPVDARAGQLTLVGSVAGVVTTVAVSDTISVYMGEGRWAHDLRCPQSARARPGWAHRLAGAGC